MIKLTKAQRVSLKKLYLRVLAGDDKPTISYRAFRRTVQFGYDCVMVPVWGFWMGIEKDGYCHS